MENVFFSSSRMFILYTCKFMMEKKGVFYIKNTHAEHKVRIAGKLWYFLCTYLQNTQAISYGMREVKLKIIGINKIQCFAMNTEKRLAFWAVPLLNKITRT